MSESYLNRFIFWGPIMTEKLNLNYNNYLEYTKKLNAKLFSSSGMYPQDAEGNGSLQLPL